MCGLIEWLGGDGGGWDGCVWWCIGWVVDQGAMCEGIIIPSVYSYLGALCG